ncbi:MAG TPA: hypothetical protein QGG47_04270 [Acidobacteriota bacterium]|nr:hypothetical protein [Acidobacteriota bacterium]
MSQLNMHMTKAFRTDLERLMRLRKIRTKSEAIRTAVTETLERATGNGDEVDYRGWIGAALKAPLELNPRFTTDDDLWNKDGR